MDLALTLDYELFGNGSGNVFTDVINPTYEILNLCDKYNAKITIFFEVIEYLRIKEEWDNGNKMGYEKNPALAMETQIKEALNLGHDIQLHIHPQWLNAKYINGNWQVDDNWCMKDIPIKKNNEFNIDLKTVLKKGKETLEKILQPVNGNYKCNIFRAGGFNILPSERIFPVLKELEFVADSSVFAGGYEINKLANINFKKIKNNIPFWFVNDNDVLNQNQKINTDSIIEFPIFAYPIIRIKKYDLNRIKIILKNKKSSLQTIQNRTENKSIIKKIKFFFEKEYITWDFCLFNQRKTNLFLKKVKQIQEISEIKYFPIVLIGHSKGFYFKETFEYLLKKKELSFFALSDAVKKIKILNEK